MRNAIVGLGFLLAAGAALGEEGWLPTLEEGLKDASRSGQAILYVTTWKPGV
jgi:hypothetical protein